MPKVRFILKYLMILISFLTVFATCQAQNHRPDDRKQSQKEDSTDMYMSDGLTNFDIARALEINGTRIFTFKLGQFEKKYKLTLAADEYRNGELVDTVLIFEEDNEYTYFIDGQESPFLDFIDQIKIFTKTDNGKAELFIDTYKFKTKKELNLKQTEDGQFFNWRSYHKTHWKLKEKVPLVVFASSWKDKDYGFHRFCGVTNLSLDEKRTRDLLAYSPNYFLIYYIISEIPEG